MSPPVRRPLLRRTLQVLLVLVLLLAGVLGVGLSARAVPAEDGAAGFALDLGAVRALALSQGGPLPREVRVQEVARGAAPRALVVAGGGLGMHPFHFVTYQLAWEDGRTVLVDPVADEATMRAAFGDVTYDAAAWDGVQRALRAADAVVVTHEHFDHAGGLARSPHLAEVAPRAALTPAQLTGPHAEEAGLGDAVRARLRPLEAGPLHLLRPGVVLVRASGHTPGTQLVYVRRADGVELLLVGDVAWTEDNLTLPRMHPRLVSWLGREDGAALAAQLGVLHRLRAREPALHQVVSHDGAQAAELVRRGVLAAGLR